MSSQSSPSLPPKQDRKLKDAALALEIFLSERGDWLLVAVPDLKYMKLSAKIAKMTNAVLIFMTLRKDDPLLKRRNCQTGAATQVCPYAVAPPIQILVYRSYNSAPRDFI